MTNQFSRTELLTGAAATKRLKASRVAVFGIGGVGSYAAEALARAGVGSLTLVDCDKVCLTNLNRQLIALHSTVGRYKTQVMAERIKDINPGAQVIEKRIFFDSNTFTEIDFSALDYVIDAIDTVTSKLLLVKSAAAANVPVISCMGAGNKLYAQFVVGDISKTSVCPLARIMRIQLKKAGIENIKAVYSTEQPLKPSADENSGCKSDCVCPPGAKINCNARRQVPGSMPYVPGSAGLIAAGEVIRHLISGELSARF